MQVCVLIVLPTKPRFHALKTRPIPAAAIYEYGPFEDLSDHSSYEHHLSSSETKA